MGSDERLLLKERRRGIHETISNLKGYSKLHFSSSTFSLEYEEVIDYYHQFIDYKLSDSSAP